jgi:cysteine-rich repeat protein
MPMRPHQSSILALALVVLVAGGCSILVKNELDDKPEACDETFCQGQANGADCSTGGQSRLCVDNCCIVPTCGDGYTNAAATPPEACDDANDNENDGCKADCTLTCTIDDDCDDDNICNGAEECGVNLAGNPICQPDVSVAVPPLGTPCDAPAGADGGVVPGQCSASATCDPI